MHFVCVFYLFILLFASLSIKDVVNINKKQVTSTRSKFCHGDPVIPFV